MAAVLPLPGGVGGVGAAVVVYRAANYGPRLLLGGAVVLVALSLNQRAG
jgi:hypothetical protein